MWKPMLAGTVALLLSGSSHVMAQQRPAPATPQTTPSAPAQAAPTSPATPKATPQKSDAKNDSSSASSASSSEDKADAKERERQANEQAELEGRLASLKVRLMLNDEQAKNWPVFEDAYRKYAATRKQLWRDFRDRKRSDNPLENMQARADFAIRRGTALNDFVTAALPLYDSLDQDQQRRLRRVALRSLMKKAHRHLDRDGHGPRWRDRGDGDWGRHGRRWRDRGDDDWGDYGRRWGGRGGDDDGCYRRHHGWHHRGDGMMGQRWNRRDRDDYDADRGGPADQQSYSDDDNYNGGRRSRSRPLKPYEERF